MTSWGPILTVPVDPGSDHVRGPVDAPVTLVEYGDFQCPSCGAAHRVVESVRESMGDDLQFVFRRFPLTTMHPHAEPAAEAAEAAAGLSGVRSGVNGTPTFFVNGLRYDGPVALPGLLDAAERARTTA